MHRTNGKLITLISIFLVSFLWFGCNTPSDRYAPVYKLFPEAELSQVVIDAKKIAELHIDPARSGNDLQTLDFISGSDFLIKNEDFLITVYDGRKSILIIDANTGQALEEFTFTGHGPGEYQRIDQLLYSEGYFLIVDTSLGKMIRYDSRFQFLEEYEIRDMFPQSGFAFQYPYFFYSVFNDPTNLLYKQSLINPEIINGFHRRIISVGKQPGGYNKMLMDVNADGELLVSGVEMPLLFFYGTDSTSSQLFRLYYPAFEADERHAEFDSRVGQEVLVNPPPVEIETNQIIRGRNLISNILYKDEEIFLIHSGIVSMLKKSGEKINHSNSFRIFDQNGDPFYPMYMFRTDDELFLSNRFKDYLVKVNLGNLN